MIAANDGWSLFALSASFVSSFAASFGFSSPPVQIIQDPIQLVAVRYGCAAEQLGAILPQS